MRILAVILVAFLICSSLAVEFQAHADASHNTQPSDHIRQKRWGYGGWGYGGGWGMRRMWGNPWGMGGMGMGYPMMGMWGR